jgi:hypothetical protein
MNKVYTLIDIESKGFRHSRIYEFIYDPDNKIFKVNFGFADLKTGGAIIDCTVTITDWWDLEVLHYRGDKVIARLRGSDVPELDSIVDYTYDGNILVLKDLCGRDEIYHFVFTKPTIHITGEYDPG